MPSEREYKYIAFVQVSYGGKTERWECRNWECRNRKWGETIGTVGWHGDWRQYCFCPNANTVFSAGCLEDIKDFLDGVMTKRKEKPNAE